MIGIGGMFRSWCGSIKFGLIRVCRKGRCSSVFGFMVLMCLLRLFGVLVGVCCLISLVILLLLFCLVLWCCLVGLVILWIF